MNILKWNPKAVDGQVKKYERYISESDCSELKPTNHKAKSPFMVDTREDLLPNSNEYQFNIDFIEKTEVAAGMYYTRVFST